MEKLRESLLQSLENAVEENANNQTKNDIRSMITRLFPDKKTLDKVNEIHAKKSYPAPSNTPTSYTVYTPSFGIKKKSKPRQKRVVADKEVEKVVQAPDDLSVEQIEQHIKDDSIEKVFGSIEAFQQYTEERFGIDYGRKKSKNSILNHFVERVESENDDDEEENIDIDEDIFND